MPSQWIRRFDRVAYHAQQLSLFLNGLIFAVAARTAASGSRQAPSREVTRLVRARFRELLRRDLENVEHGYYPRRLLFQFPVRKYIRSLPALMRDAPRILRRKQRGNFSDLPREVDTGRYPPYYRRNFHWQTDGYLSDHSAAVYDLSVELLFLGTADIMRRQVIPPIAEFLRGQDPASVRLLDIGCGTGRTLKQLATAQPALRYHGVDLSPYYIKAARALLADTAEVSLLVENAEALPYIDEYFDIITSVYLFHELPRNPRRRVLREAYRLLRPGGLLVLEDSAQLSDSEELGEILASFPGEYHEPFYRGYLDDDLAAIAEECGFVVESVQVHLVTKAVVARKPAH